MVEPLLIAVAPNGAYKGREDHPQLPLTPTQLADTAEACLAAGAGMLHLHVRDEQGGHTLDPGRYREAMEEIHGRTGDRLLIQMTSEAAGIFTPEEQMSAMRTLCPAAYSVALRELLPAGEAVATHFLREMHDVGCFAQLILYHPEELSHYLQLLASNRVPELPLLLVMGRYREGQQSSPQDLLPFLAHHEVLERSWMLCAFGAAEFRCALAGLSLGGHIRVGFENCLLDRHGEPARDNAQLVAEVAEAARLAGRSLADGSQARQIMGVLPRD